MLGILIIQFNHSINSLIKFTLPLGTKMIVDLHIRLTLFCDLHQKKLVNTNTFLENPITCGLDKQTNSGTLQIWPCPGDAFQPDFVLCVMYS